MILLKYHLVCVVRMVRLCYNPIRRRKRQRDKETNEFFISMLVGVRVGQNTNYKIYILYNINII